MVAPSDKSEYYNLPDSLERTEFLRKLTSEHNFILEAPSKKKEEFLDTFDRRLNNSSLILVKEKGSYMLKNVNSGTTLSEFKEAGTTIPKFWWDLPKCTLKKELKPVIGIRALLSLIEIERSITTLRLLNKDKKTVLFLYLKDLKTSNGTEKKPSAIVQVRPVRGYENDGREFKKYLISIGLSHTQGDILTAVAPYPGKYPLNYSSKLNIKLRPKMKSNQAAKVIFTNLLNTMKVNEFGIMEDIDTEFLHDFRVAVRRTRSALSQIKEIFSQDTTDQFKAHFNTIGKATNLLRDMDVYLLTEDYYKSMLPQDLRQGLDPLFDSVAKDREIAHKECTSFLKSKEYKDIIRQWEDFLEKEDPSSEDARNCDRPIIELAKEHIWKKYSKVIRQGKKIDDKTPDPELHSLRIECKKLRYLLEFFSTLFPEEDMKIIIKHLKKLQDNLGDFNDLHVQQESLKEFLSDTNIGYDQSKQKTLASAGGLISVLYQRQMGVRKKFKENFDEFSDKETSALFQKLFSGN